MEIWYLGYASFRIRTKKGIIITNPYNADTKLLFPKMEGDIVLNNRKESPHSEAELVRGDPFVINAPGEYEIGGINVFGFSCQQNTTFLVNVDGISMCHLGWLEDKLTPKELDKINSPEVVFVPVGLPGGLKSKTAIETVRKLEAKIIIPVHYQVKEAKKKINQIEPVKKFLEEIGSEIEPKQKLIVNPSDLIFEGEKVIPIERRK